MMNLAASLREFLPADSVGDAPAVLQAHDGDKWFAHRLPDVVVWAGSTAEVSATLRFANEHRLPVTARGAGYGYVGGVVPERGGIALSVARLNRILEIHDRDFIAVVEPGVITGDLQSAVRARGMFYPPDPASLKHCTLGGNIATNAGGPRCLKYGVTRHYVLGLEVVLADGRVVEVGGRAHKNKTGFDLIGMFVGSEGMLGVVTRATLRLLPHPPARAAISAAMPTIRDAAAAVQSIFSAGHLPAALEIADKFTLAAARAHLGEMVPAGDGHLLLELDGHAGAIRAELADLAALIERSGSTDVKTAFGDADVEALWALRRGFSESLKASGLTKLNEDVTVPRGRLVDLMDFAAGLQAKYGDAVACFGHAGDGNIHVNIMAADYEAPEVRARVDRALDELFRQVIAWGGAITGEHGIGLAKKRWWPEAVSAENFALHRRVKAALDPHGILNPGKFLD